MPVDLAAAHRFVLANARLLDRHRFALLTGAAPREPVLAALRAYRNPDGGFGHALEPDVRSPHSEPASVLHALDVLADADALDDPMVAGAAAWVGSVASPDGGVPFVTPSAAAYPHAPWMVPSPGGSQLTFAIAGTLARAGSDDPWVERGVAWCWNALSEPAELGAYGLKFALDFLDSVPDEARARETIATIAPRLGPDGSIPVPGGQEGERLTALKLSDRPHRRSRALFADEQIARDLDELERGQRDDGGWTFDWLAWSPGQTVEWGGALTLHAVATLAAHGRVDPAAARD